MCYLWRFPIKHIIFRSRVGYVSIVIIVSSYFFTLRMPHTSFFSNLSFPYRMTIEKMFYTITRKVFISFKNDSYSIFSLSSFI